MAIIGGVSTSADLVEAMLAAAPGDEIACDAGNYGAHAASNITRNADAAGWASFDDLNVVIRPADRNNPPRFNVGRFEWTNIEGFTLDGINFHGSAIETPIPGVSAPGTYPDLTEALRFYNSRNIRFVNCDVRWHLSSLRITNCDFFEVDRCHFFEAGIDNIMLYGSSRDLHIHNSVLDDPRIDYGRHHEAVRHPDAIQARCNTSQVGTNPFHDLVIEDNDFAFDSQSGKPIFLSTQGGAVGIGFVDTSILRNQMATGRAHCIFVQGGQNTMIEGNRSRSLTTNTPEIPRISIYGPSNTGTSSNNVTARANTYQNGASASDLTQTGNVISATASPSGWTELVPGVNVGPYTGVGEVPDTPTQPTVEAEHGGFAGYEAVPGEAGRYAPVLEVPTWSPAFAALSASAVNGRWIRPGVATVKPFDFASPKFNAAGALRLRCKGGGLGDLDIFSVAPGGSMAGLTWEWKLDGGSVYSGMSTYAGSISVPVDPGAPTKPPALTAGQWSIDATAIETSPGHYTCAVALGVTFTGAQWFLEGGDGQPRPLVGIGGGLYRLAPLEPGGTEHIVGYDGTLVFRPAYAEDAVFSDPSADAKTFTAPSAPGLPPVLDGWDVGDLLLDSGLAQRVAGFPLVIAGPGLPPPIVAESGNPVYVSEGVATITLPATPPAGAVAQIILYAGRPYLAGGDPPGASFPVVEGELLVWAAGVTPEGKLGHLAFWPVEA